MTARFKDHWPVVVILALLGAAFTVVFLSSLIPTQNLFVYPLDDSYIHLSIARNFSQDGVWGIAPDGFSSLSSSLLWTLLLSLSFLMLGAHASVPLFLSLAAAVLLLFRTYRLFKKNHVRPWLNFLGLFSLLLFTPLLPVIFTGLEHTLHALLTLAFVYTAARILAQPERIKSDVLVLSSLTALAVMARYESLFVVFIAGLLFLLRKKWQHTLGLAISAMLPLVIFGVISLQKGWYFFPNSVVLKGRTPELSSLADFTGWLVNPWVLALKNPHLLIVILASLLLMIFQIHKNKVFWKLSTSMNTLFLGTALLHIQFAKLGWFYRYEAYLMALGLIVITVTSQELFPLGSVREAWQKQWKKSPARAVEIGTFALILIAVLAFRGTYALLKIPAACRNIHEQQYQMGLFLQEYYSKENIAANDIGAIHWLSDTRCLDLWGLSSMEVAQIRRSRQYHPRSIHTLTTSKQVKSAILYDHWFYEFGGLPPEWTKVAQWQIANNVVCGGDTVTFYAVDPQEKDKLISYLEEFAPRLPPDVVYHLLE